ncbi:hypothetical protein C8Q69DRAFT_457964 [Paecilomyces variotii]|uniref:Uncharacterized protein n=1 Tax=Byssochlamys spectabilis TaxID=264951 RepID=A0A443I270_BYSSP|nr:hypothetical protein C8Q69DRAFT_457964 [Paecilomyces variotii]RWQ98164.1 hypothetical protein C8Q69DRAFT_457964 [Paecilomyces variotii]
MIQRSSLAFLGLFLAHSAFVKEKAPLHPGYEMAFLWIRTRGATNMEAWMYKRPLGSGDSNFSWAWEKLQIHSMQL